MIKRFMVLHNIKATTDDDNVVYDDNVVTLSDFVPTQVEGDDSSKSSVNQKATEVIQVNDCEKKDEQTPCSKVAGKRSAEKGVLELTAYELDGDEAATKSVKLKSVKLEPKD